MTVNDLADYALPSARYALKQARPLARARVGLAGWLLLAPAWAVVTGPLLPLLVRLGVELAVALTAPQLLPVVTVLEPLAEKFLSAELRALVAGVHELLSTPTASLSEPVQATLAAPEAVVFAERYA